MKKEVMFENFLGRNQTKTFEITNYYCPNCGKKEVWMDSGDEDYYEGPTFLCTSCENVFTLPTLRKAKSSHHEIYFIEQLNKK